MYKYLVVKSTLSIRDNIIGGLMYPAESILGTIIAKNRSTATAKAIELFNPLAIVVIYSSLSESELRLAKQSPVLWEQPEGNPVTIHNPKGAGVRRLPGILTQLSVKLRLTEDGAKWYRSQPNKSDAIANLIEQAAKNQVSIAMIDK